MKKLIALALVMLMAAVCLSACSDRIMTTVDATEAPAVTEAPTAEPLVEATDELLPEATDEVVTEDAEVTLP